MALTANSAARPRASARRPVGRRRGAVPAGRRSSPAAASSRARTRSSSGGVAGTRARGRGRRGCARAHSSPTSSSARRRSSARESRDLTVPARSPSARGGLGLRELEQIAAGEITSRSASRRRSARRAADRGVRSRGAPLSGDGTASPWATLPGSARHEPLAPSGRDPPVTSLVRDDLQQPGSKPSAPAKAVERTVSLHERVLGRLLRLRGRTRDHPGRAKGDRLVLLTTSLVGHRVAALRALDQRGLVQWPVLHCTDSYNPRAGSVPARRHRIGSTRPIHREV